MSDRTLRFDGWVSGAVYDLVARLTGYGPGYYRRAAAAAPLRPGLSVLDLGCGTGSLMVALAERMGATASSHEQTMGPREQTTRPREQTTRPHEQTTRPHEQTTRPHEQTMQPYGRVVGLDVSPRQLARARDKIAASPVAGVSMALRRASMGALPFEDDAFDGVAISQVLHALPEDVLPQTFAEIARVLRPGGFLALVEWSRPRLGYAALVWLPTLLGLRHSRNWRGTFPELVAPAGLNLVTERYLDSLNRYQLFTKPYPQDAHRPQ